MKKILAIAVVALLCQGALMAQNEKAVAEKDVKVNYVKDFQHQVKDASDICWYQLDEQTFKVRYNDSEKSPMAMVFSNKGSETHYYIESKYYPNAIKDTVQNLYPKHIIHEVWVRKMRGKMTYQATIAKKSGFLFWKKLSDFKTLNFEIDGKFINAQ